MGVRGLQSFLENECPDACYKVSIESLVNAYKAEFKQTPVVVVDCMSLLNPLYKEFSWLNGGQLKEFKAKVDKFINNFTQLGCELVVFNDGAMQVFKLPVWKKRRMQSAQAIAETLDYLREHGTKAAEENSSTQVLPSGLSLIFNQAVVENEKCKFFCAIRECDEEIAEYASKHKCFAILAQDTDFVIYRAARYYLSALRLDLETMTTVCYDGNALAHCLHISPTDLPLLASLMGNDVISYDSLQNFHRSLNRRRYGSKTWVHTARKVGEYILSLRGCRNTDSIARDAFGYSHMGSLLQQSINSYDIGKPVKYDFEGDSGESFSGDDSNWKNIIEFIRKEYVKSPLLSSFYDFFIINRFTSSTCLEDYRTKEYMPVGMVTKRLRQWIYGIILAEKPKTDGENFISELVMTGFDSLHDYVKVYPIYLKKAEHPGILNLFTSTGEEIMDKRWSILEEVFNISKTQLKSIPSVLLIPIVALKYLLDLPVGLKEWECDAILSCNITVVDYDVIQLSQLPSDPIDYRSIWLYSALTRTYSIVKMLFQVVGIHAAPFYQFTDGKLYHFKYRLAQTLVKPDVLCCHKVQFIDQFCHLKALIFTNNKP